MSTPQASSLTLSEAAMLSNQIAILDDDFYKLSSDFYVLRGEFGNNKFLLNYETQVLPVGGFSWFNVGYRCRLLRGVAEKRERDKSGSRPNLIESAEYSRLLALFGQKKNELIGLRTQLEGSNFYLYKTRDIRYQLIGNQARATRLSSGTARSGIGHSNRKKATIAINNRSKISKRAQESEKAKAMARSISPITKESCLPATDNPSSKRQKPQKSKVRNPVAAPSLDAPRMQLPRNGRSAKPPLGIGAMIANKMVDAYNINPLFGEGQMTPQQVWKHYLERRMT